ncbi:endo-1,4-beta-xylanase, partial [Bacteroides cellulosilyticus]
RSIVDANFNSVTLGNAMKMDAIVNGKGETNFTKVDAFLLVLHQDIALYGHNLIWHTQHSTLLDIMSRRTLSPHIRNSPAWWCSTMLQTVVSKGLSTI